MESSTPHGGAALLRDGEPVGVFLLEEGLRHGRELAASVATLLESQGVGSEELWGVAVSFGPGSYTGIRVGVMAAKALAWAAGCRLAAVSSLAALAQTRVIEGGAGEGDAILALQDARRDETYVGRYRVREGYVVPEFPDVAVTPEEAAGFLRQMRDADGRLVLAGSSFATYKSILGDTDAAGGRVDPAAVGLLGRRQILREDCADPMALQPVYLRRDAGADWRHDHLIAGTKS